MTNDLCLGERDSEELGLLPGENAQGTGQGRHQGRQRRGAREAPGAGPQESGTQGQLGCAQEGSLWASLSHFLSVKGGTEQFPQNNVL